MAVVTAVVAVAEAAAVDPMGNLTLSSAVVALVMADFLPTM